jgi:hypothetical protein
VGPGYYDQKDSLANKVDKHSHVNFGAGGERFQVKEKLLIPGPGYYDSASCKDYIQTKSQYPRKIRKSASVYQLEPVNKEKTEFDFRLVPISQEGNI